MAYYDILGLKILKYLKIIHVILFINFKQVRRKGTRQFICVRLIWLSNNEKYDFFREPQLRCIEA
jgi:hypothetical protein